MATRLRQGDGSRYLDTAWRGERAERELHPAWRRFIAYCAALGHGEVERLRIEDGLPALAEQTRKKVKFL